MPKYVVLNRSQHSLKTWKPAENYKFAARSNLVALLIPDVAAAAAETPIGLVRVNDNFQLVALLAFNSGENAFVGPDGKWLMRYIPATLRGYPFIMARQPGSDQAVLCIDEESECFGSGEERFFELDGSPTPAVQRAVAFHTSLGAAQKQTIAAIKGLEEAGLLVPWDIKFKSGQNVRSLSGLYRIDGSALERLDDQNVLKLHKLNAFAIAYGQLVSMHQLSTVERLSEIQARLRRHASSASPEQVAELLKKNDGLIF